MKNAHRKFRLRMAAVVGVAVAALGAAGGVQAASAAEKPPPPRESAGAAKLPADIQKALKDFQQVTPGPGFVPQSAYVVTKGTQTYTCLKDGPWPGSTPEATLSRLPFGGDTIHHYGGPRWAAKDGSILLGAVRERVPQDGTIPWLLLDVTPEGKPGALSRVTNISRILTSGGTAPAGDCTAGQEVVSPYKAVYVFWVKKPS